MSREINFVRQRRKELTLQQQKDRQILRISAIVCAAAVVIALSALGGRLYFNHQLEQLDTEQTALRQAIVTQQPLEEDFTIFVHKLRAVTDLFDVRKDKQDALQFFGSVFGPLVRVGEIDYSASDQDIVSFTIRAPSVFVIESVFKTLDSEIVTGEYASVSRSGLRRTDTGEYSVKLTVQLQDTALVGEE